MTDLKSCPFCGGVAEYKPSKKEMRKNPNTCFRMSVICTSCKVESKISKVYSDDTGARNDLAIAEVTELWNKRVN